MSPISTQYTIFTFENSSILQYNNFIFKSFPKLGVNTIPVLPHRQRRQKIISFPLSSLTRKTKPQIPSIRVHSNFNSETFHSSNPPHPKTSPLTVSSNLTRRALAARDLRQWPCGNSHPLATGSSPPRSPSLHFA